MIRNVSEVSEVNEVNEVNTYELWFNEHMLNSTLSKIKFY
jgi:hypothetical protein